jgi:hypothetical protein
MATNSITLDDVSVTADAPAPAPASPRLIAPTAPVSTATPNYCAALLARPLPSSMPIHLAPSTPRPRRPERAQGPSLR